MNEIGLDIVFLFFAPKCLLIKTILILKRNYGFSHIFLEAFAKILSIYKNRFSIDQEIFTAQSAFILEGVKEFYFANSVKIHICDDKNSQLGPISVNDRVISPLPGLNVIKLKYSLKLKMKHNDWLAACGHVSASSQSLGFILSLRMNSSFITSRPAFC